ncbi:hypothetical protein G5714_001262 [Onychostoma macrolepis]|uniref:Uncharacterized protein n=1 Tax=Onychostoma macrolepis TaxID=369639 RepID=A0A7J6DJC9_9TELE|nr:hypothetical protein G5714_001262 [Onychostoma macrolepis]
MFFSLLKKFTGHSDFQTHRNHKTFTDNLQQIFQDLESKIITFLKKELENFKKILQKENTQCFVKDFNENRSSITEAALDLSLCFLREMKQDEAADTLEDELFFIHQLKCSLKKKYQCVFEGITNQGDSTLLEPHQASCKDTQCRGRGRHAMEEATYRVDKSPSQNLEYLLHPKEFQTLRPHECTREQMAWQRLRKVNFEQYDGLITFVNINHIH